MYTPLTLGSVGHEAGLWVSGSLCHLAALQWHLVCCAGTVCVPLVLNHACPLGPER